MPLINVRLIENVFVPEQKQQITRDLTEAVASKASACAA
jgi:phenylpyruvate tautomerase PptA (4-oxalocrotonate tautomerase family)